MNLNKVVRKNSKLIALFLFQYTLLIPLMGIISSSLLVAVSGILIVLCVLFNNYKLKINIKMIAVMFTILLILLFKSFQIGSSIESIIRIVTIVAPVVIIYIYPFDYKIFIDESVKLAKVGFILICWYPFLPDFEYMRFGYGMLPVVIFTYIEFMYSKENFEKKEEFYKKIFAIGVAGIGALEIFLYGARGSIFSLGLFIVLERFFISKKNIVFNSIILVIVIVIYRYIVPILEFMEQIAQRMGIYSYSIRKFKMQMSKGFLEASSGRGKLYARAIEKIKEHPLVGNAIVVEDSGGDYTHNLFLQVAQDLGIIALIVLVIFLVYILINIWRNETSVQEKIIYSVLFSISIGRLMFSSTLWRRPEFWMLVCFTLVAKRNTKKLMKLKEKVVEG